MERRIQYARTSDGASIAFRVTGQGRPIVSMPALPYGHMRLDEALTDRSPIASYLESVASLIEYDARGTGLSDRDRLDYSLESLVSDAMTVADALRLERFDLLAIHHMSTAAMRFAAAYSERISRLVLIAPYATAGQFWELPRAKAFRAMREVDWETYKDVIGRMFPGMMGVASPQSSSGFTADTVAAFMDASMSFDASADLGRIVAPALVLNLGMMRLDVSSQQVAAGITGAQLASAGDMPAAARIIADFLELPRPPEGPEAGVFRTIMFTDLEGSTTLTERLGDLDAQRVIRRHNEIVRDALRTGAGSEVKHTGDGIMASFASASRALECATAIQRNVAKAEMPVGVRIGLNAGEPVAEEGDLFGTAVITAARIADRAQGGEILVSDVVRQLVVGKGFLFNDRGETALRGFEEPVRVWEARWRQEGDAE